jgi:hypothetical protein
MLPRDSSRIWSWPQHYLVDLEFLEKRSNGLPCLWKLRTSACAGRGIMKGGIISVKLFNILVDAIAWEWTQELQEGSKLEVDKIDH